LHFKYARERHQRVSNEIGIQAEGKSITKILVDLAYGLMKLKPQLLITAGDPLTASVDSRG
jgi:hypothetical protein